MTPRSFARASLLLAAVTAASGSLAQALGPDAVKARAGEWLVAPDDGRPGCRVRLKADTTVGGMAASPAADCASRIPILADVEAWHMAGGITLSDAARKPVLVFTEDEPPVLKTRQGEPPVLKTRQGEPPAYFMFKPNRGVDRAPHASAVFGTWQMRRPGGPNICTVAFRNRPPAGGQKGYALEIGPACDAAIRRLNLASWRIEDVSLVLYGSDGEGLRFAPTATGFEKVARSKGDRPLQLARQP